MRYSHFDLMLYVTRVDISLEFYRNVLGFEFEGWTDSKNGSPVNSFEAAGYPEYVTLSAGTITISLHKKHDPGNAEAVFHFQVDDIYALQSQLIENGLNPNDPVDQPWGWKTLTIRDPDMHEWCFYSPIEKEE